MKRRDFCKSAWQVALLAAANSLIPLRVFAAPSLAVESKPSFFVLMRVFGGWDTSLCMDPWAGIQRPAEADYFLEYRQDELLPFASGFVGPALAPLKAYFDRLAVVNGIFVTANDGGHDSAANYLTTGNGQGRLGILNLELEGRKFDSPFGVLTNTSPFRGNSTQGVWDLNDLVRAGKLGGSDLLLDLDEQGSDIAQIRQALVRQAPRMKIFNSLFSSYREKNNFTAMASAFRSGLSSSAFNLSFSGNLDTHSAHAKNHLSALGAVFSDVKGLLDLFASSPGVAADGSQIESNTLLDQTTVMVVSEFCRTPALNSSQGKDHNPQSNSALVIGPNIKNGIFGASTLVTSSKSLSGVSYLAGLPLDVQTHLPVQRRQDSFILRPENLVATLVKSLGVDPIAISRDLGAATLLKEMLKA